MNPRLPFYLFAYKIACLLSGVICIFLGYRLFLAGLLGPATLEAAKGSLSFAMRNAAPGTFFALFGTFVVGLTVFRGLNFDSSSDVQGETKKASERNSTDASYHWQRVWDSIQRLGQEGKIPQDELSFLQHDLSGLAANSAEITTKHVTKRSTERFGGISSGPR
jgi:hypothetical protein